MTTEWARITEIALRNRAPRRLGQDNCKHADLACAMAGATMAANEFVDEQ